MVQQRTNDLSVAIAVSGLDSGSHSNAQAGGDDMNGPVREAILCALAASPHGLTTDELIVKVYRGVNEPDFARDSIWVTIHNIRKLTLPFRIETVYRCGRRYQLLFT